MSWIYEFGDDFVMEAMKRALERGKFTFGYVKGILNAWVKQGIQSVETLKAKEIAMNNARRSNSNSQYRNARNQEVVPDWFLERKRKKRIHKQNVSEEDIVKMEEILKKYKN
ncbi:DnaD domain protein [Ornithinibacillus bavariensis]|uniref:DnaD domain protein n=1 Tax=Ornithinibacillus bavariensis TaxID=545502 RepID=UPI003D22CDAB